MALIDENAAVLASISERGVDLSVPRSVDFAHLLYELGPAELFKSAAEKAGYAVKLVIYGDPEDLERVANDPAWDVTASTTFIPTAESITRVEEELDALAHSFGGHADGWGFFSS